MMTKSNTFNSDILLDALDDEYLHKREKVISSPIPLSLQQSSFRFCLVRKKAKEAFEKNWQNTANYRYDDPKLLEHIRAGGNYGIIGGYGGLVVLDIDRKHFVDYVLEYLPRTFTVRTKKGIHLYYVVPDGEIRSQGLKFQETGYSIGDVKAGYVKKPIGRGYVVGPGSTHPSGDRYTVQDDHPIVAMPDERFQSMLKRAILSMGPQVQETNVKEGLKEIIQMIERKSDSHFKDDPKYLQYLPLWYRTYHRKRNGSIIRTGEGRRIHLRICATLKKHDREHWKKYAHHLTQWMLGSDYDVGKTEKELEGIDARYYFRKNDYFSFKGLDADFQYLTEDELVKIRKVLAEHWDD